MHLYDFSLKNNCSIHLSFNLYFIPLAVNSNYFGNSEMHYFIYLCCFDVKSYMHSGSVFRLFSVPPKKHNFKDQ